MCYNSHSECSAGPREILADAGRPDRTTTLDRIDTVGTWIRWAAVEILRNNLIPKYLQ